MFYYLLAGASEEERAMFHLQKPEEYHYLNQVGAQPHWHDHWIPVLIPTAEGTAVYTKSYFCDSLSNLLFL